MPPYQHLFVFALAGNRLFNFGHAQRLILIDSLTYRMTLFGCSVNLHQFRTSNLIWLMWLMWPLSGLSTTRKRVVKGWTEKCRKREKIETDESRKSENEKLGQKSANWLMGLSVGIKAH